MNTGFRTQLLWMDELVETLSDVPCRPGVILLVGINPAPVSVAAGHYYQGTLGKRLWGRLQGLGLLVNSIPGCEDEAWASAGHGLTDLVKRPSPSADALADEEMRAGIDRVREKVRAWKPSLILFPFKKAAEVLLGVPIRPGEGPSFEGVRTFLLSGPYAPRSETAQVDAELLRLLPVSASRQKEHSLPKVGLTANDLYGKTLSPTQEEGLGVMHSQRVTANDLQSGQLRFPQDTKRLFPRERSQVRVNLRGAVVEGHYDPRTGPDRERSAVLRVGRGVLANLVQENEVLRVSRGPDGIVRLD